MDNSNQAPMNRQTDHLGVNKMGKNIKKSPSHQPNFASPARQQPQPQVYNINKNDFRNIVQQLTGSPSREPLARPLQNQPKQPNNRLQRVRPPPLAPTSRPQVPVHPYLPIPVPAQAQPLVPLPYANNFTRPPPPSQFDHQPSPTIWLPSTPTDIWTNTTESPISAYMRYLQNSIIDSGPQQPQSQPQVPGHNIPPPHLLPNPPMPLLPSPRVNGPPPTVPSPRLNGPPTLLASPHMSVPPPTVPSPRMNVLLPFYPLRLLSSFYLPLLASGICCLPDHLIHCFPQDISILPQFHLIFHFLTLASQGFWVLDLSYLPPLVMDFLCRLLVFFLYLAQDGGTNNLQLGATGV